MTTELVRVVADRPKENPEARELRGLGGAGKLPTVRLQLPEAGTFLPARSPWLFTHRAAIALRFKRGGSDSPFGTTLGLHLPTKRGSPNGSPPGTTQGLQLPKRGSPDELTRL